MRGSVRQFALILLTATYTVLWTCGSAWHLASCRHCHHAGTAGSAAGCSSTAACGCDLSVSPFLRSGSNSQKSNSGHTPQTADGHGSHQQGPDQHDSRQHVPTPLRPTPHDSRDCEICQLFAQPSTSVLMAGIECCPERVEGFECFPPTSVPARERIVATSRGPPQC